MRLGRVIYGNVNTSKMLYFLKICNKMGKCEDFIWLSNGYMGFMSFSAVVKMIW